MLVALQLNIVCLNVLTVSLGIICKQDTPRDLADTCGLLHF